MDYLKMKYEEKGIASKWDQEASKNCHLTIGQKDFKLKLIKREK